ncbi:MAG: hypothetical protein P4M08_10340 [Oligoflexia bacterium]|nr:hypothetical protein [Oligoflexia bacterium]
MFDLSKTDPSKVREVMAPFSMDVMREFFLDKSKIFVINYAESQLKGKSLLIYLSNLDIPCEIRFTPDVSLDEKFEMLKCYMESRNMFSVPSFTLSVADALILSKQDRTDLEFKSTIFNKEELKLFIEKNPALIGNWQRFCDSLPLYAITTTQAYRSAFGEAPQEGAEVIDDPFFVGQNVVDLFYVPGFFESYFSTAPKSAPAFFKRQFWEQMFRGKNLFHFFYNPNNSLLGMLVALMEKRVRPEDLRLEV